MPQSPKRIIVAYRRHPPIIEYLKRAFTNYGVEVIPFDIDDNTWFDKWVVHAVNKQLHNLRILPKSKSLFEDHPLTHRNYLNTKLWEAYKEHKPDLVVLIRDSVFGRDSLKKMDCIKFGWWIEPETRIHEIEDEIHLFDAYFCMNERAVQNLRADGVQNVSYLQHAVDVTTFHRLSDANKKIDLCFVGMYSDKRLSMIEAALDVTQNVVIYGPGWNEKCRFNGKVKPHVLGESIRGPALNRLYNESRVVLNVTNWQAGDGLKSSGMNMRLMEVPATGSCLLTDEILELEHFFEVGKDLLAYKDAQDLKLKLKWCIDNPSLCEQIGSHGKDTVAQKYTYNQTAQTIINKFQEIKGR